MNNLLEQWNEHIIRGNQLSRELEDIEDLLAKSYTSDICFTASDTEKLFIRVLSPEKMKELKDKTVTAIVQAKNEKTIELEKLMGIRKPAYVNPEFEAAVQDMEKHIKKKPNPDPVEEKLTEILDKQAEEIKKAPAIPKYSEMTIEDVRRMYQDENMSQGSIAAYYGVKKVVVNTFLQKHKLFRKSSKKDDIFLDEKVESRQKQKKPADDKERP
ncbi:MAG: hypothetical protein K0S76_1891 [Herbinix sp.]|nr:hypothetical protein [Herbinix sp.]